MRTNHELKNSVLVQIKYLLCRGTGFQANDPNLALMETGVLMSLLSQGDVGMGDGGGCGHRVMILPLWNQNSDNR